MNDSKVDLSEYFFFFYPIRNIGGGLKVKSRMERQILGNINNRFDNEQNLQGIIQDIKNNNSIEIKIKGSNI